MDSPNESVATPQAYPQVKVEQLLTDDNARFGLKQTRIDALTENILEVGGVMQAIEVEPLPGPWVEGAPIYRVTDGHYRVAAVTKLNKEGAGLTLPLTIRTATTPLDRLKRQLSANLERENPSPMDKAVAIKKLLDLGVPRIDIRNIFKVPGGAKGLKNQPLSNSSLNMHVSFLSFTKPIQEKIHDGRLGILAAYELAKRPKDKHAAILEAAEKERQSIIDEELKDERRFLETERREAEKEARFEETKQRLERVKLEAEAAAALVKEKGAETAAAFTTWKTGSMDDAAKKSAEEVLRAKEKESQEAEKAAAAARKQLDALTIKVQSAAGLAKERAAKLKKSREEAAAAKKKNASPTAADIKKADKSGPVPLTYVDFKKYLANLAYLPGAPPRVIAVAKVLVRCYTEGLTESQLFSALAIATGEKEDPMDKTVGAKKGGVRLTTKEEHSAAAVAGGTLKDTIKSEKAAK